jgi:hypothetical protein
MRIFLILVVWTPLTVTAMSLVACGGANQRTPIERGDGSGGGDGDGALGKLTARECGDNKKELLDLPALMERLRSLDADPAKVYYREMFAYPATAVNQIPDITSTESANPLFTTHFLNADPNGMLGLQPNRLIRLLQTQSLFRVSVPNGASAGCSELTIRFLPSFEAFHSIREVETRPEAGTGSDELEDLIRRLLEAQAGDDPDEEAGDGDDIEEEPQQTVTEDAVVAEGINEKVVTFEVNQEDSTRDRLVLKAENQDFWLVYSVNRRRGEEELTVKVMIPSDIPSCAEGEDRLPYVLEFVQVLSWNNNTVRISKSFLDKIETHLIDTQDLDDINEDGETVDIGFNTAVILSGKTEDEQAITCPIAAVETADVDAAADPQTVIVETE